MNFPSNVFQAPGTSPGASHIGDMCQIRSSVPGPVTITATWPCGHEFSTLRTISAIYDGRGVVITHLSISVGENKLFDSAIEKASHGFELRPDVTVPYTERFTDLTIVLVAEFEGPESELIIEKVVLLLLR